jgi:site-specific recombinase XerD
VHLHRFRHWYAMQLLNAGANLRVVQECLRHRKVASTQMYTLITSEQRRAAVNALPMLTTNGG